MAETVLRLAKRATFARCSVHVRCATYNDITMSFNFALAFLPHTTPSMLGESSHAAISFDEASTSSMRGASSAACGPHTLLVDPTMQILDTSFVSTSGTTTVLLSGVADTYVVRIDGDSPRLRVFSQYEVAEEEGVPVPAESVFEEIDDPEDAHLEFFCRMAGITVNELWTLDWTPLAP